MAWWHRSTPPLTPEEANRQVQQLPRERAASMQTRDPVVELWKERHQRAEMQQRTFEAERAAEDRRRTGEDQARRRREHEAMVIRERLREPGPKVTRTPGAHRPLVPGSFQP